MQAIGYALSGEEHAPQALVDNAVRAERAGFEFALVSDHYHPWIDQQGNSPFVWTVLGAIAQKTTKLRVGTGVTCPLMRVHPAIIAQAAATTAALFGDRFFLGLGTGENLNEHILGDRWPRSGVRLEMMAEAIEILRALWTGEELSYEGAYYLVDQARIYSLPKQPPPIYLSATGPVAVELAATAADGMIGVAPDKELLTAFKRQSREGSKDQNKNDRQSKSQTAGQTKGRAGSKSKDDGKVKNKDGRGSKPTYGQITVCWAKSVAEARRTVHKWWPQSGLQGDLSWEVKTPALFECASATLTPEQVTEDMPLGPDTRAYLKAIRKYADAGYDYIYLHQVGPDQEGFFRFYERQLASKL